MVTSHVDPDPVAPLRRKKLDARVLFKSCAVLRSEEKLHSLIAVNCETGTCNSGSCRDNVITWCTFVSVWRKAPAVVQVVVRCENIRRVFTKNTSHIFNAFTIIKPEQPFIASGGFLASFQ
jgi:hypothetical protein